MKYSTRQVAAILVSLCFLGGVQNALAAAGKALFVTGSVNVERNGTRPLEVGDAVEVGDVIVTGEASRAQLLMGDGARIALRAVSRFRIDTLALPSNIQQVGRGASIAASGKTVSTLLKGGFRTRTGVIGKSDPSAYEVRTPIGTLGVRGTDYTAVFCRGDCTDAPGIAPGQPIPDGLYLAVDEGTITFNGRGLSLVLPAPRFEFIPLQTGEPQQLPQPPAFLRQDGGGPLALAGRPAPGAAAATDTQLAGFNDRRSPSDADPSPERPTAPETTPEPETGITGDPSEKPQQTVSATSPFGNPVDLTDPVVPADPQNDLAIAVPGGGNSVGFVAGTTLSNEQLVFNAQGALTQFTAPIVTAGVPSSAVYDLGTATPADAGTDAATGISWARWTAGTATATRGTVPLNIDLANASLHWILGPNFEIAPVLPVTGTAGFVLAGGTDPTDTLGNVGTLGSAGLQADFTTATVTSTLALNLNGFDWIASGTGPIAAGGSTFGGAYNNVVVDGRVSGAGNFNGFFTADPTGGALTGAGVSYTLNEIIGSLGTISGVAALVPGTVVLPTPTVVQRHLAYGFSSIGQTFGNDDAEVNTLAQLTTSGGLLTQFSAAVPGATPPGIVAIGTAGNVNSGTDSTTGLQWGRWTGGDANLTPPGGPATTLSLATGSLHWIIGTPYGAMPALPQTGTADYVLVGGTNPTDTRSNVGAVGAASFAADFTNATVSSAVNLTIDGREWYAAGNGSYTAGVNGFTGLYVANLGSIIPGSGSYSGFFSVPTFGDATVPGAGLTYRFHDIFAFDEISGVLAFRQGAGQPLPPPALADRDIAISSIVPFGQAVQVLTTPAQFYATDVNFNLTRLVGLINTAPEDFATFDIGTSATVESNMDPVTLMRWGRWSGGDITITGITNGQSFAANLAQQSVHWIEGANGSTPPVLPSTGTASYTLFGFTQPTDSVGNVGTLNAATFDADFTSFTVDSRLNLTVNNLNWVVVGAGTIGGQTTPGHQFNGTYTGGINPIQGVANGSFSGFFTAPGSTVPGVPGGVGLTYSLIDGQGLNQVNGAVVFRGP